MPAPADQPTAPTPTGGDGPKPFSNLGFEAQANLLDFFALLLEIDRRLSREFAADTEGAGPAPPEDSLQ